MKKIILLLGLISLFLMLIITINTQAANPADFNFYYEKDYDSGSHIRDIEISPNEEYLGIAYDNTAKVFWLSNMSEAASIAMGTCFEVDFDDSSNRMIFCGDSVKVLDLSDMSTILWDGDNVSGTVYSCDMTDSYIAVGDNDDCFIFDSSYNFVGEHYAQKQVQDVEFSPGGDTLVFAEYGAGDNTYLLNTSEYSVNSHNLSELEANAWDLNSNDEGVNLPDVHGLEWWGNNILIGHNVVSDIYYKFDKRISDGDVSQHPYVQGDGSGYRSGIHDNYMLYANTYGAYVGYVTNNVTLTSFTNQSISSYNDVCDLSSNYAIWENSDGDGFVVYSTETYGEPEPTEDDFIIVKLYDIETGNQLEYYESPFVGPIDVTANIVWGKFYINNEEMNLNSSYLLDENRLKIQLTSDDFELGDTNTLELRGYTTSNNPRGAVNGVYKTFSNYTTTKILYSGNTYNIYLTPIDFTTETQENVEEYTGTELYWYLSTDKYNYTTGEQLILKYKLPSKFELADNGGVPDSGYQITIHKEGISWWDRFWGDYSGTAEYITTEALVYGEYAYLYIDVNDLNPEEGVTNYEINIFSPDQGPFWVRINPTGDPDGLWFRVVNGTLTPTGSISSLDPSEPKIGENVNISFTGNNRGKLTYEELNDITENEYTITLFEKPTGTAYAYTAFWNPSTYIIREYIWNGYEYVEVDNEFLYVNTSGQNYSGYNVEYMQISKDRYIAGYSHAEIAYKSLGNNATFTITTPKGETSRYSTVLPAGEGVYRFFISQDSPIGKYNVTFKGQETFESYFYVVYDENNYIEFGKHSYYEDESFDVYLKFDTRIGLIFKKENTLGNYIPQGQTIFFEKGLEIGYKNIPRNIITPSEGNWIVEMWEVNNRVPIRLKATHDCIVIPRTATEPILEPVESDLLPPIDGVLGAIVGLIITLFCTLSPFILLKGLKAKQNPPAITYAISGGTGIVVSVILGFFPFFVLPFILIAGIIILLMQYVVNNKGGNGGE